MPPRKTARAGLGAKGRSLWQPVHPLQPLFAPRCVAVIGATENPNSVGCSLTRNLTADHFDGTVYPVNPRRSEVFGRKAYPTIRSIPEPVDLAVIATPAPTVPSLIRECGQAGVGAAIVISAGFKEVGPEGCALEEEIRVSIRQSGLRVLGPNCLGVMVPHLGLNATFACFLARPGRVGFISQSGALCTAVLDWSLRENVGFSAFVSVGSMLDVGWGDLIGYLGDDPRTKSIVAYMESLDNARSFLSAAREVALAKPIIVIKVGRCESAARAATLHTGAAAGSDAVFDAALRRVGVMRVETISELFDMAEVLGKQPRPSGPRLAIVTNAGGPAVLATDMLVARGGRLAELSSDTLAALDRFLPAHWSRNNPVDILGDATPERFAKSVELVAKDTANDGLLVILTPHAMTDPRGAAEQLVRSPRPANKPILASWMGGAEVSAGEAILNQAGIPTFDFPDAAARAFDDLWRYGCRLQSLYETPSLPSVSERADRVRQQLESIVRRARRNLKEPSGSTPRLLSPGDAALVLESYDIPIGPNAASVEPDGGRRRSGSKDGGGAVFDLFLGSRIDAQFGPVLFFGRAGATEASSGSRVVGLPPLNTTLARRLIEESPNYSELREALNAGDLRALEEVLVRFSRLIVEQRWIDRIVIDPLVAGRGTLWAARTEVSLLANDPKATDVGPAIRPYPAQYIRSIRLNDGAVVILRPIRPEDEPLMVRFHRTLSERTVYSRYFAPLGLDRRIAHERLARICFIDYDRELALVAEPEQKSGIDRGIVAVGRLSKLHGLNEAEIALLVSDPWQDRGLGTHLLALLLEVGRAEQLEALRLTTRADNRAMLRLCRKFRFEIRSEPGAIEFQAIAKMKRPGRPGCVKSL